MSPPTQGITSKVEVGSQRTPKEDVALEKEIARVRRQMEEEKARQEANGEDGVEDPYEYKTPFYPKPLYRRWEPGHQEWQPGHAGLSHLYRSPSDAPPPRPYHHTRLPRRPHAETLVEEGSNKATANPKLSRREARRIRKIHKRNPALKKYLSSSARVRAPGEEQLVRKPKTRFDRIVERFISRNWHPEVVQVLTQRGIDIKDFPTGDLTRKLNQDKGRLKWLIKRKFRKISRRLHQRFSSETSDTSGTELATLPRDRTVFPDLQYFKDSPDQRTPPRFCPQIPLPKERERGPAYDKHLNPAGVDLQIWLTTPEEAEDHYRRQQAYLAHRSASNNWLRIQGRKQIDDWLIGRAPPISQRRLNRVIEHHLARQPIPNLKDRPLQLEEVDIGIREPPRADNIVGWEQLYLANRIKPSFKKEVPSVRRNSSESEEDYFNLEECDITSAPRVRDSSPGKNLLSAPVPQEYPKSTKSAKPSPLRTVAFQADEPLVRKPSVPRSKPLVAEAQSFRKYRQENPGLQGIIKDSIKSGKFFKRTKVKNQEPLRTAAILIETEVTQTFEPAPGYKSTQTNPKPSAVKNVKSSGLLSLKKHSSKDLSSLKESENSSAQNLKEIDTQVTSKSKESSGIVEVPRAQHIENQSQLSLATPVISQAPTKHTASSKKTSPLQRPPPSLVSSFDFEEKLPSSATPTPDKRDPFATPDKDSPVLFNSPFSDSDSASASSPCPVKQYNRRFPTPLKESVSGSSAKETKETVKQFLDEAHQRPIESRDSHQPPVLSVKRRTDSEERPRKDLDCQSYELQVLPKAYGSVSSLLRSSVSVGTNLPVKGLSSPVVPQTPSYEFQVLPQAYGSVSSLLNDSLSPDPPLKEFPSLAVPDFGNEASLNRCLRPQDKVSAENHWSWLPCGDEGFAVASHSSVKDQESFKDTSVQDTTTQETTVEDLSSVSDIEETKASSVSDTVEDQTSFPAPQFHSSVAKTEDFRHSLDLLHVGGTFTEEFRLPEVPHVDKPPDLKLCIPSEVPESESSFASLHIPSEARKRLHTEPETEDHNPASKFREAPQATREVNPLERPGSQPSKEDLRTRQARLSLKFCKLLERSAEIKAQAPYCAQKEISSIPEGSPVCSETSSNNSPSQPQSLESLEDLVETDCGRIPYRTALAQGAKVLCYEGRGQATPSKLDRPARRPNRVAADSPKASFENFEQPRVIHGVVVPRERLQARLQSLRHSKVLQPSGIVPSSLAANHTREDALCSEESGKPVSSLDTRSLAEAKIAGTYDEKELFERNYQRILEDRALYTIKTGSGVFGNIRDKKLASLKRDSSPQSGDINSNQKGEGDFNRFQSQGLPSLPTTPELPPPNIPDKSPLRVQGVECVDFAKPSAKDCGLKSGIDSVSDTWAAPKPPPATFLAPPIIRVRPSRVHEKTKALGAYNQHLQLEQESFFNMDSSRLSARPAQYSSQRSQQVEDARQMQQSVFEAAKKAGKDPPKYTLLQLIGKGAFGRVYKGKDMETAAVVAIKTIDIDESDTLNPRQADAYGDFLKEVNALTALSEIKARNINHVIEALPVGKSMWMITEYCAGGSVSTLMNPTKPGGLQEKWIIPIVREVAEAIRWVHSVKIIHRDIKCGNVLVTEQGGVQLCDFGISSMLDSKLDKRKTVIGTPNWMAPELFDGRAIYGQDIDIWAFGAMIYEIATGLPPNAGLAFDDIGTTLKKSAPRLEGGNYSNELRDLVAFCLEEIPSARPDIEDVEKHPYIYNTGSKYPTSSLTGLVRAYKMWEDHGGSRKSLFMAGGAQGPSEVNSNAFDGEWNFSTTAAFDQQVDRESNPQDVFDAYGTSVELDTSFAQRSTPQKGRRRPPPQALAPIKNPLERVFDQKTMSNYNDNSRERYGLDGNHQEQQYEFMGDLPLRNDTIQQPTRESLIDLGGYDAGMGISSFNDMDTIKASRRGRDEDIDDDYGETPSFNRPALSDPEQVGNNRRTQDWKFPSMAPPASADPEISRFPSSYNPPLPAMTPGSGGRPALIHHPTEPLGTAFGGVATSNALDRMSVSSLIDLDMSVPDPIDFSARPSTANSDVGSVTSELTSSRNPFEFEKHASRVPPQFDGADEANEPEIYVTDGGTHSRLQSGGSFRDMGDVSDFSASETEVPYRNGGHSRYVSEASDSDYMTMAPPSRPAAQQQGQSSYSVGHFPDLPLPPSAAALSGTASDREMAVEFHRMIDGLTGQLESFRDVYDELKPVTVARRPSQRRERDDDTA